MLGTNGRRLGTLVAAGFCALAVVPASADAVDMTLKGRFTCNDGQPLADMRVELMRTRSRVLPEIWPNQTVEAAGRTGPNGEWEWQVSGGETNWRVRAVLVNNDVGVTDFPATWHHFSDTLRTQNDRPLADYGTQVVPGAECRLWRAFKSAADGYRADTGSSSPAGKVTVVDNAPTAGVPFTPYTDVFWPGEYAPIRNLGSAEEPVMRSVAEHEFAHAFRHALDGNKAHFTHDSARFWYLRQHSATSCASTNHGFVFNERWAEYWADEVPATPCPNRAGLQHRAQRLGRAQAPAVRVHRLSRGRMVQILAQNRGQIHSMADFSNALGCQPRRVIRRSGKAPTNRPARLVSAAVVARTLAGRRFLANLSRLILETRATLPSTSDFAERTLLRARIDQAKSLRETFGYLGSRTRQRRIARLTDQAQVALIAARQRAHLTRVRAISSRALRLVANRLRRAGDRASAQLIERARTGASSGRIDVLQTVGRPLGTSLQTSGPDPQTGTTPTPDPSLPGAVPDITMPPSLPTGPSPPPPPPCPLPDLVVTRVYGAETAADQCDIIADVQNAGGGNAPASSTRFLSSQPGAFDQLVETPALAPGQTTTVRLPLSYGSTTRRRSRRTAPARWRRATRPTTPPPAPGYRTPPAAAGTRNSKGRPPRALVGRAAAARRRLSRTPSSSTIRARSLRTPRAAIPSRRFGGSAAACATSLTCSSSRAIRPIGRWPASCCVAWGSACRRPSRPRKARRPPTVTRSLRTSTRVSGRGLLTTSR